METSTLNEVIKQVRGMPQSLQQQVLEFARSLADSPVQGVPGSQLLRFAGTISPQDTESMREIIAQDCGQVDLNEW
ncbi:MAG: hypothetical protein LH647_16705 [Leptolyngbyaceae cyanobacterium CAN_BIN12]|nr:hypothetical protein [Leptolyngbyaceae cyanobacterium CAN_BIN12]